MSSTDCSAGNKEMCIRVRVCLPAPAGVFEPLRLVHACTRLCAPHGGSPRDLWLCVLPRWQINVNVYARVARLILIDCVVRMFTTHLWVVQPPIREDAGVAAPVVRRHVGSLPRCAGYRQGLQPTSASKRARRPRPLPAGGVGLLVCGLSRCEALRMGLHAAQRAPAQESRNKVAQLARRLGCAASCA